MTNDFYLNVTKHGNEILVCGYRDGERYKQKVKYEPYLFLPDKSGTYKNLWGDPVRRKDFPNMKEAQKFIDRYRDLEGFKWYGYNRWVYPFIHDNWLEEINPDLSQINTQVLDIEVGKNVAGEFATVDKADAPITLIGLRTKTNMRIIFGWKPLGPEVNETLKRKYDNHFHYVQFANEVDMLEGFINAWSDNDSRPDVVTGWNIEKYDIPMLVNRIKKLLGEDQARRLSPWGILREKTIEAFGREQTIYIPVGLAVLDYYDLYKKFTYNQLESYTLDHVAFHEVGRGKLDFRSRGFSSLDELYAKDFGLFVEYNIEDLDRVFDIDVKNRFIELAFTIAYQAKVNPIDSLTSVLLWEVISHNYLLDRGIVFHHDMKTESRKIPGGYNFEVRVGPHKWVVSIDLRSLYPHLEMWANISPECYVDMESWPLDNNEHCPKHEDIIAGKFQERSGFSRAGNGARFRKDREGFMPALMKKFFALRKLYKDQMLEAKKNKADLNEITRLDNAQKAIKIMLNSFYGATANPGFAFYNWRIAGAITLSGQLAIRWIEDRVTKVLNDTFGVTRRWTIAGDTDSLYLDLSTVVETALPGETNTEKIVNFLDSFSEQYLQPEIKKAYDELGRIMNAYEPDKLIMNRDVIADSAIWRAKKCYAMRVWDEEGVRYNPPKIKIMGLEVVKAIIPQECRLALKHAIYLILDGDKDGAQTYVAEFKKKFITLKVEEIAFPRGCNGIDEYSDLTTIWKKGTPIHVKGALSYNFQINKNHLESQYSLIHSGEKVKFVYLREPNTTGAGVISFPQVLPQELSLHRFVDYDKMFDKTFLEPVKSLMDLLGWEVREKRNTLEALFG